MKAKRQRKRACLHQLRIWDERWLKRLGGPDEGKKSRRFEFKPGVNIVIGPNGSGKSTLLELIFDSISVVKKDRRGVSLSGDPGMYQRFDFEKHNPRGRTDGFMMMDLHAMQMHFAATSHSHGETTAKLLEMLAQSKQAPYRSFLFDEPEQALDPVGLMVLRQQLLHTRARQVILATHALPLVLEPSFHVVELRPGYRRELAVAIMDYVARAAELL